jgi:cell division protein FtsL
MIKLNLLLIVVLVFSAFGLIQSQHRARHLFNEHKQGQRVAEQMEIERNQLEVEQSRLASPGQVNRVAQRDLKMQRITPPQTIYIDGRDKPMAQAQPGDKPMQPQGLR